MKLKNPHGKEAMEIQSIKPEGEVLAMKGVALGSMPITVHITAADVYEARTLMSWGLVRRAGAMFVQGWREANRSERASATSE